MSDQSTADARQLEIAKNDRKTVNLDDLNIKINRLNRYIAQAERRSGLHQKELDKLGQKLRHEKDFAARHLDQSATLRREV